ncbi:MAG: 50S ribosomal protein L3 [Candidatus Pacebacteria bacterium]|nr:50S ribosomal protein L3 [Candidatus Paceibacterota bacterium]
MTGFILGKKLKMAQIFKEEKAIPVTLIGAGPCVVTQIKTKEKDGYEAVQIGFEKIKKEKKIKKTQKDKPFKFLREFKTDKIEEFKVGDVIDVSKFQIGEKVKVSGISKGKGFQGVVKRWGFSGRNKTHGVKHEERTPGSIGSAFPQRVIKGKKMPGRMGGERVTVKNLEIVDIDKERNLLVIKGAVPGRRGTLLEIQTIKQ